MRMRTLLLTTTALMPIVLSPALAGADGGTVVGGAATISGQGSSHVIVQPVEPERDRELEHVQPRDRRARAVHPAELVVGHPQPRHRRARALADPGQHRRERAGVHRQPRRDHFRARRGDQDRRVPGDDERHQEQRLHGRDATTSTSRAGRMPRSSIRGRSRRRTEALRRWWRRACATPAPSRPISAR